MSETRKSWWHRATQEQRLAQIDGGIRCGMTANQVGMNVGAKGQVVQNFAQQFGRKFNGTSVGLKRASEVGAHISRRRLAEKYGWTIADNVDAKIFASEAQESLFDPRPYEEA